MIGKKTQIICAFLFGCVFICSLLVLALVVPNPTQYQYQTFRIVMSLAAAGVAAMIPGFLKVELTAATEVTIRAGGALAVFVIVYFFNPARLPEKGDQPSEQPVVINGGNNQFGSGNVQNIGTDSNTLSKVASLDEKTQDIVKLPDGRLKIGSVITGEPRAFIQEYAVGFQNLTNSNFEVALQHFQAAIHLVDLSGQTELPLRPDWSLYAQAAFCAQKLEKYEIANQYALTATRWQNQDMHQEDFYLRMIGLLSFLADDNLKRMDFSNALALEQKAIQYYQSLVSTSQIKPMSALGFGLVARAKDTLSKIPKTDVLRMFKVASYCAIQIGQTNEAIQFSNSVVNILKSN